MRKLEAIENSRMFQGLPSGLLRDLASSFRFEDFPERVLLAQTGETVEHIGVVIAGSAEFKVMDRLDNPVRFQERACAAMPLAEVIRNGQITLPKELRTALGIREGDLLEVKMTKSGMIIKPKARF